MVLALPSRYGLKYRPNTRFASTRCAMSPHITRVITHLEVVGRQLIERPHFMEKSK